MKAVFHKPRLLAAFEHESQIWREQFNCLGERRQRAPGATGNAGALPIGGDKRCRIVADTFRH